MELQKLWVSLQLKADEFGQGLDEARKQADGFASGLRGRLGGALGSLQTVGTAAFLGVGAAAVGGFGAAMGAAIDMNASLESSTLQFTTLMGDADKATAHVTSLFEFAANTPYESQQIIDASLKLQTFGGEALNTMDNLTLVGDAAAAVGAPIDEVSFWVGRLYSNLQAGAPFGEAAARLQELGIMGPTARSELEGMQAAGASANDIFSTFQGQLGEFTGAMELQAGTWSGLMSTIKDNVMMAAAEGLKPFFDIAKQGLEGVAVWLSSPEVQEGIQSFAARVTEVIQAIATFVTERVIPFVQEHGPLLKTILIALAGAFAGLLIIGAVTSAIALLTNPITLIIAAIGLLAAAWHSNWGGIRDKVQAVIDFIVPIIETVVDAARSFAANLQEGMSPLDAFIEAIWDIAPQPVLDALVNFRDNILPGLVAAFEAIRAKVTEFVGAVGPALQGFLTNVGTWWQETWPLVQQTIQNVWSVIQGVIQSAIAVIWPAIQSFIGALAPIWEQLKALWPTLVAMWEAAKPVLLAVLAVVGAALVTLVGLASGVINGLSQALGPLIQGIVGAVQGIIQVFTGVFETLRGLFQLIVGLFTGNTELIKEGWENLKSGISNIVGGLVSGVLSLFGGLVEGVVGFVRGLVEGVVGFFSNLFDRLVGHSVVTDLVERILALWQMLWGVVETVVRAGVEVVIGVFDAFKALFTGDFEGLKEALLGIWNTLWKTFTGVLDTLWGFFKPKFDVIWNNLKGWFNDKIEDFKQLGRDLIDGIINGLDEVGDKIRQTLVDWATKAWDGVKEFFGIKSPATKGKDAGRNIGEGLIEGVLDSGEDFWYRTEKVFNAYYENIEEWYISRPWAELVEYTTETWQEALVQLWPVTGPRYVEWHETLTEWWITRPWADLVEHTIVEFDKKFATLADRLRPTWDDFWLTAAYVFRDQDWPGIGRGLVDGVVHGVNSNAGSLEAAMRDMAKRALEAAEAELGIASPARATIPIGEAIVDGLIYGINSQQEELLWGIDQLVYEIEETLGRAGMAGNAATGFAKRLTDTLIAPAEERLEALTATIEGVAPMFAWETGGELILNPVDWRHTLAQLAQLRASMVEQGRASWLVDQVDDAMAALQERNQLNQEYMEQQERLLALEKARADVDFLRSQLEMLKLIQENGMDASILEGLQLGLDADAGALMDTMVDVMNQLVRSAEDELGIHSPSAWAADTMRNVMETMAATAEQERAGLRNSLSRVFAESMEPVLSATEPQVGAQTTDNSRRTTNYGGYYVTVQSSREAWLEEQDVLMR